MEFSNELEIERLVLQRVAVLNSQGLWKRIKEKPPPKVPKCHWDYVLEEMQWMSRIIMQERALKDKQTKKCAKMIQNYFRMEEMKLSRIAKEEESQRRRTAQQISKMVRQFWNNADKLVNYKVASIIDIARRRSLDEKLNQVLNQSEKFVEEISSNLETQTRGPELENDTDFVISSSASESDVEDTIEQEERLSKLKPKDYSDEINELEAENNMSYEELLAKYSSYLGTNEGKSPDITVAHSQGSQSSSGSRRNQKQPKRRSRNSSSANSSNERQDVKDNGCVQTPETRGYSLRSRPKRDNSAETKIDVENNNDPKTRIKRSPSECSEVGLDDLFKDSASGSNFQPSGHTFESTKVTTKVPFLLLHQLREYQHIGLDWLAALYDRKLNGILADEMGLGKTIQTIALLAYLAVEKGNWGPHLIIVPTSLMMNWELEFLRWCPSFKILTYFGNSKDRKQKRIGWSVPNTFHICITSYTLAVQDHLCFRRRPWEYMILDEAHNIKNFKSQRWQVLLNFNTKNRLLLTGTPLQNNLMELWSLLHFLMPHVFESHSEFKEWFSKPISEISSGSREYNENIVKQFHKTLRPFMLRRLKSEVEKQMPQKIEHVIKCNLSKRQRRLYNEFMARSDTKNSINCGSFLNVLNVLMQLRKVCNHPDLFEPRPVISSYRMEGVCPTFPKCVWDVASFDFNINDLMNIQLCGSKNTNLDNGRIEHELVYEPDIEVRNIDCHNSRRVNVYCEEIPTPQAPVILAATYENAQKVFWKFIFEDDNGYNDAYGSIDGDGLENNLVSDDGEEGISSPFSLSQSSFSQSQSSYSVWNSTMDTETDEDVKIDVRSDTTDYGTDEYEDSGPQEYFPSSPSLMLLPEVKERIVSDRKAAVQNLNIVNRRRCQIRALLDKDLIDHCSIIGKLPSFLNTTRTLRKCRLIALENLGCASKSGFGTGAGYAAIMTLHNIRKVNPNLVNHPVFLWRMTKGLNDLLRTIEELLSSVCLDFVFCIPTVCIIAFPEEKIYTPPTATIQYRSLQNRDQFRNQLVKPLSILHPIASRLATSLPDPRLVEYDCGKLQVLSGLLRKLKSEGHKVLLFTQMTKMLNILEAFLNYQGHIYLRLDGSTKVDQRQLLVERFNKDEKIFCFLLSTRAGGLGINLTGADTVIFYDSDWNPTIDAQAQDRCHRIGQTRDVHIYRLISENSVEENILKTSNQKKLLGEHAIEEGKFNMEFFKKDTFRQLFDLPAVADRAGQNTSRNENTELLSQEALESALAAAEDDVDDRKAAVAAMQEVEADRDEFCEDAPSDKTAMDLKQLKNDFLEAFSNFNDVERYALRYIDSSFDDWTDELVEKIMQTYVQEENETSVPSSEIFTDEDSVDEDNRHDVKLEPQSESESDDSSESLFSPVVKRRTSVTC